MTIFREKDEARSMVPKEWFRLLHPKTVFLVTTVDSKGRINAAPFSWLTPLCDDPPILLLSAWYESHTFKNIKETKEFVLNVVPKGLKSKMLICAKSFPKGVNELEKAGLSWSPSKYVRPPRVDECIAWLECVSREVRKEEEFSFIVADVKCAETKKNGYTKDILPKLDVLLHLGGEHYSSMRV